MLTNTDSRYGLVSRALHWLMALMIVALIAVGLYMSDLDQQDAARAQIYALHKAFGVTVLGLAVLRILWIRISQPPPLPGALQAWEVLLARIVTGVLYLLMIAAPLAGYLMSSAAGKPVSFFGLFTLPALVAENKDLAEALHEVHEFLAWAILALAGLHALGALKHRFVDKDPSADVLGRML